MNTFNSVTSKIDLLDVVIKSLNEIKTQNSLIQHSLNNQSQNCDHRSISVEINEHDLEKNINVINQKKNINNNNTPQ